MHPKLLLPIHWPRHDQHPWAASLWGKAKRIYASNKEAEVLVEFKNDATAFNAQKRAQLEDKGRLNCQISACLFELLELEGIPTHYCGFESNHWMVVQRVKVIPI